MIRLVMIRLCMFKKMLFPYNGCFMTLLKSQHEETQFVLSVGKNYGIIMV